MFMLVGCYYMCLNQKKNKQTADFPLECIELYLRWRPRIYQFPRLAEIDATHVNWSYPSQFCNVNSKHKLKKDIL